ncbi:MAG: extracellular solute-binding protein [Clostridiaceae bacterium]|nr:extracellular solute-binding protein [Clostridiaceae bacterium]
MKKYLSILLALLLMFGLLSACGKTEQPPATDPPAKTDPPKETEKDDGDLSAEITIWSMPLTSGVDYDEILKNDLIAPFNKTYPNVKVEVDMMTWEGGPERLTIALGTGATPDIYLDGTARTAALPTKAKLVDMTDVLDKHRDKILPSLLTIGLVDGKNYLVPNSAMTSSTFTLNLTLAKKLGVDNLIPEDRNKWSRDDMYELLKAAAEAGKNEGIYGVALYAGSATEDIRYYSLMLSNGGKIVSDDKKTCLANSPECVEVITFLKKLVDDGLAAPGAATIKSEDVATLFYNSKALMMLAGGPGSTYTLLKRMKEEKSIDEVPELISVGIPTKDGKSPYVSASWGANMFATFENKNDADKIAAAKALLDFYWNAPDAHKNIALNSSYVPAMQGMQVDYPDPVLKGLIEEANYCLKEFGDSSFGILEPFWVELRSVFYPELQAVFSNTKTPQEAMDTFKTKVDEILNK